MRMNYYINLVTIVYTFIFASFNLVGQDSFVHNELLIKFDDPSIFSAESVECIHVGNIMGLDTEIWCVPDTLEFGGETIVGVEAIADYFESFVGIIKYAEPNYLFAAFGEPNDPLYSEMWGMPKINAPAAWDIQEGDEDMVVAVLDTGIDWQHPDLKDNIWQNSGEDTDGDGVLEWTGTQWVFDPDDINGIDDDGNGYADDFIGWDFINNNNMPIDICGHGTHVAGTIGALGNNEIGVIGVSPNVKIMPLKILDLYSDGRCRGPIDKIAEAVNYASTMGVKISNNSYGGGPNSAVMREAIEQAESQNHLFIASAGNDGFNTDNLSVYPASYDLPNIISVAATNQQDLLSSFGNGKSSNYGATTVDLGAPGSNILSTTPNNSYNSNQGTSMASPHVAGAAALIASQCDQYSYLEIKDLLLSTVNMVSDLDGKCVSGGILDVGNALNSIASSCNETSCRQSDSLALVALYNSTDGPNWKVKWDLSEPMDNWHGVLLNDDGCVSYLNLILNDLSGTLPAELGDLFYLEYLNLFQNNLTGNIPPELGNLSNLRSLNLAVNGLTGTIPIEFVKLTNLESLNLHQNELVGNIPAELGNLSNLEFLGLSYNQFTGTIPIELGNLANLKNLYLNNNNLSGCYPPSLCDLNLEEYEFNNNTDLPDGGSDQSFIDFCAGNAPCDNNVSCSTSDSLALVAFYNATDGLDWDLSQPMNTWSGVTLNSDGCVYSLVLSYYGLTGTLPAELGDLAKLQSLNLLNNELRGTIPIELGSLSNLRALNLGGNQLTGTIPTELGNLYNLEVLRLYNNQLTGNIPVELSNLFYLRNLELFNNELTGTIPIELGNLSNLRSLNLTSNELTGTIPIELGNLSNLENLALDGNELTGTIPSELGNLSNLRGLYLSNNLLTGTIPVELGNLYNLEYLELWSNGLTGTIPSELGNLSNLKVLSLSYNALTGNIPIELGNLLNLERLSLNGNNLTGNIPSELGNLSNLKLLALSYNTLTGTIPKELGNLYNLEYLEIWENDLTGSIPAELGKLSSLRSLNLAVNELTGTIPIELGNLLNLESLSLGGNNLTGSIPPELGNLSKLEFLWLAYNELTDAIPSELGNLSNLKKLHLHGNNLSGCYPPSLCDLNLEEYDFNNNADLPDGGSDQSFIDFCDGTTICESIDCIPPTVDLGEDQTVGCGEQINLSTNLSNMAYTLWDFEGTIVAVNEESIIIDLPGTYTVLVTDSCGNAAMDTIEIGQVGNCVWPGDINYDQIVNVLDFLAWGSDFGKVGNARNDMTISWSGKSATDWENTDPNGVNDKHSDTNGNGEIELSDLDAIELNYGKTHGGEIQSTATPTDGFLALQPSWGASSIDSGKLVIDIILDQTIESLYGLAWSLDFSKMEIDEVEFVYESDWFGIEGEGGNVKSFSYYNPLSKRLDIAITRLDTDNINGGGLVGRLIVQEDNVGSWEADLRNPVLRKRNGDLFSLNNFVQASSAMNIEMDQLSLKAGWNLISFDILPFDLSIEKVFADLKNGNLEYVVGYDNGALLYDANGERTLNTLNTIEKGFGYWVKVKEDDEMSVYGTPISKSFEKPINAGWNLTSFHSQYSYLPEIYYEDIIAEGNLAFVSGYDGQELIFNPNNTANNTLDKLNNGSGYWVKLNKAEEGGSTENTIFRSNIFDFVNGTSNLQKGEEIYIQNQNGSSVAKIEVMAGGKIMTFPIYGDDPGSTGIIEGILEGDVLSFVWDGQIAEINVNFNGDKTVHIVDLKFEVPYVSILDNIVDTEPDTDSDAELDTDSENRLGDGVDSELENVAVLAYPNPAVNTINFDVKLIRPNGKLIIEIFNINGELIDKVVASDLIEGVNNVPIDLSPLAIGMYWYRVMVEGKEYSASFIKAK